MNLKKKKKRKSHKRNLNLCNTLNLNFFRKFKEEKLYTKNNLFLTMRKNLSRLSKNRRYLRNLCLDLFLEPCGKSDIE